MTSVSNIARYNRILCGNMNKLMALVLAVGLSGVSTATPPAPVSVAGLKAFAATAGGEIRFEGERHSLPGVRQSLASMEVDGLKQFLLVQVPDMPVPVGGFPVLVYCHGFHPTPYEYGRRTADGVTDRPGDYYRPVPQAYARGGFAVITPDYRGHNDSAGGEFTGASLSLNWYARDVVGLIRSLAQLSDVDTSKVFVTGHSLGAVVAILAAMTLDKDIKAVSAWSGMFSDAETLAAYWASRAETTDSESSGEIRGALERLNAEYQAQPSALALDEVSYWEHLDWLRAPIALHHAVGDTSTLYVGSVRLAKELLKRNREVRFYSYRSTDHLFEGEEFELAVRRDIAYFKSFLD